MNDVASGNHTRAFEALWRIFNRSDNPKIGDVGGDLPYSDPDFSARMLKEHFNGNASRTERERLIQVSWIWNTFGLQRGALVCDLACGPGLYAVELARRGAIVTGIDMAPAAISYARRYAEDEMLSGLCQFRQEDVLTAELPKGRFDLILILYGQFCVLSAENGSGLLARLMEALNDKGVLIVEIPDRAQIPKCLERQWLTSNGGLWGNDPHIHFSERLWDEERGVTTWRFYTFHLDTGDLDEYHIFDQSYSIEGMTSLLRVAGFDNVGVFPESGGLQLHDAATWNIYFARRTASALTSSCTKSDPF